MPFYKVRHNNSPFQEYAGGPQTDAEAAIMQFNAEYGPRIDKTFTTEKIGTADGDYVLIEQERQGAVGLHEIKSIDLYKKT